MRFHPQLIKFKTCKTPDRPGWQSMLTQAETWCWCVIAVLDWGLSTHELIQPHASQRTSSKRVPSELALFLWQMAHPSLQPFAAHASFAVAAENARTLPAAVPTASNKCPAAPARALPFFFACSVTPIHSSSQTCFRSIYHGKFIRDSALLNCTPYQDPVPMQDMRSVRCLIKVLSLLACLHEQQQRC